MQCRFRSGTVVGLGLLLSSPAAAQDFTTSIHDSYSNNRSAVMGSHQAKLRAKKLQALPAQRPAAQGKIDTRGLTLKQLLQRQRERARLRDRYGQD